MHYIMKQSINCISTVEEERGMSVVRLAGVGIRATGLR